MRKNDPYHDIKIYHMADKINEQGEVSALCYKRPRVINLKRGQSWVFEAERATCKKCLAIIATSLREKQRTRFLLDNLNKEMRYRLTNGLRLTVFKQVLLGTLCDLRVVSPSSQDGIARAAKKPPDSPRLVVMVNAEGMSARRLATNCTDGVLRQKDFRVSIERQPVSTQTINTTTRSFASFSLKVATIAALRCRSPLFAHYIFLVMTSFAVAHSTVSGSFQGMKVAERFHFPAVFTSLLRGKEVGRDDWKRIVYNRGGHAVFSYTENGMARLVREVPTLVRAVSILARNHFGGLRFETY